MANILFMPQLPFSALEAWQAEHELSRAGLARALGVDSQTLNGWRVRGRVSYLQADRVAEIIAKAPIQETRKRASPSGAEPLAATSRIEAANGRDPWQSPNAIAETFAEIQPPWPVLDWADVGRYCDHGAAAVTPKGMMACPEAMGQGYVLVVQDRSMLPRFAPGRQHLWISQDMEPRDGDFIVVQLPGEPEPTFRRYAASAGGAVLQALAPDWEPRAQKMPAGSRIMGVLAFHGEVLRRPIAYGKPRFETQQRERVAKILSQNIPRMEEFRPEDREQIVDFVSSLALVPVVYAPQSEGAEPKVHGQHEKHARDY